DRLRSVAGFLEFAERRSGEHGCLMPTTAALDVPGTRSQIQRIRLWRVGVVVGRIEVLAPLENVAVHVEQTKSVGLLFADRLRRIQRTRIQWTRIAPTHLVQ